MFASGKSKDKVKFQATKILHAKQHSEKTDIVSEEYSSTNESSTNSRSVSYSTLASNTISHQGSSIQVREHSKIDKQLKQQMIHTVMVDNSQVTLQYSIIF